MRQLLLTIVCFLSITPAFSQPELSYYLPDEQYNPDIPTPGDVVGHDVGEWHITHDKLVMYMKELAKVSDRMTIKETGKTYEGRPLLILTITSPENHSRLEEIRQEHLQLSDPDANATVDAQPVVVYMGFSIHGNEPSGSNASLLTAYYLAASNSPQVTNWLDNSVILFDPSFNPDGLQRFASWVNSRKGQLINPDPNSEENNEPWPRGRTNHYWFDLNRDWLTSQLPESQARLKTFQDWKPNVLTDHHEMGSNATFFFQPGIPSRNNPLTPEQTYVLTEEIGKFHAEALDSIGSLYYTKESYDDFYYGKGSTYPDVNGGVGILFEQASSRGHAQEGSNGVVRFPFTIRNQFNTTLSTIRAANSLRTDLLEHQKEFYQSAIREASGLSQKAWVLGARDPWRTYHFAKLLERNRIKYQVVNDDIKINDLDFEAGEALYIPLNQPQYRIITTLFERRTTFEDSLFYDVSAWNMPMAFNMEYASMDARGIREIAKGSESIEKPVGTVVGGKAAYAYLIDWKNYYSPAVLNELLENDLLVKVATSPFNGPQNIKFPEGTLMIPVNQVEMDSDEVYKLLNETCTNFGVTAYATSGGLDYEGHSLGSPTFNAVEKRKIAILTGNGVSGYEAGEVWHLFDERMKIPSTIMEAELVNSVDLGRYNTIIMVDGSYRSITERGKEKLKSWVQNGGIIIGVKDALSFLNESGLGSFEFKSGENEDSVLQKRYADMNADRGAQAIGGSIFEVKTDLTHPLLYGYYNNRLALFKDDRLFLKPSKNSYANPVVYTESPLLGGYISEEAMELLKGSSALGVDSYGSGRIIGFTTDLNFRAFWLGTNKIFLNAVFFGPIISRGATR